MADLRLNITGDSSSAQDALTDVGGVATDTGKMVAASMAAAGAAVVAFGVSAFKAYAESEKGLRQLRRAAGEYSDAIEAQSKALSKLYAVDDDLINQSATLLSQWGGAAAATRENEEAALNLAAAYGTDLKTATEMLIRNVESGGAGLAKMGIQFEATGDRGKDLASAVAAINGKLGGAAAADANSLTGQLRSASLAFEDIKKSIGGSIAEFIEQTGAVDKLTQGLRNLNEFLFNEGAEKLLREGQRQSDWVQAQLELAYAQDELKQALGSPNVSLDALELFQDDVTRAQAKVDKLKASVGALSGAPAVSGTTNKGLKGSSGQKVEVQAHAETAAAHDEIYKHEEESAERNFTKLEKMRFDLAKSSVEVMAKESEAAEKNVAKQEDLWASAGTSIGQAFVSSLSRELERLMDGGDMDAGEAIANVIGDVLAVAGQVIGTAIGSAYGGAAGAQLGGALGGAAGGLLGTGVKSLGRAGRKKYHDGGPIDDAPRYHSGGPLGADEMHIIAQRGENMWSRADVAAAGGQQAVEAMKSGGAPRFSFVINTIDALGTRQFFENDGGRGFFNALRTGRGSLLPAFGGG